MLTDRKVKIQPPELGSQQVGQVSDFFPIVMKMHLFVILNIFASVDFFIIVLNMEMQIKLDSLFWIPELHGIADLLEGI